MKEKISKILNENKILDWILWLISFIILVGVFIFHFVIKDATIVNLLVGLLVVSLMLAIARETFSKMEKSISKMDKSTKETVEELKLTNKRLNSVAQSLEVVAKDVLENKELIPCLNLSFSGNKTRIDLRAGDECPLEIWFLNDGSVQANNPNWSIFFPPGIQITDMSNLVKELQVPNSIYEGYTALIYSIQAIPSGHYFKSSVIKIKSERTTIGLIKIPFSCSCDKVGGKRGELFINFIG